MTEQDNGKGRGWNLVAGQEAGDRGRVAGGKARAILFNALPAPDDCQHCQMMRYSTMAQHIGHLGFRAVMDHHPTALSSLKEKVARTGLPESRARWKEVSA